jgi:hypothetical protein
VRVHAFLDGARDRAHVIRHVATVTRFRCNCDYSAIIFERDVIHAVLEFHSVWSGVTCVSAAEGDDALEVRVHIPESVGRHSASLLEARTPQLEASRR